MKIFINNTFASRGEGHREGYGKVDLPEVKIKQSLAQAGN